MYIKLKKITLIYGGRGTTFGPVQCWLDFLLFLKKKIKDVTVEIRYLCRDIHFLQESYFSPLPFMENIFFPRKGDADDQPDLYYSRMTII